MSTTRHLRNRALAGVAAAALGLAALSGCSSIGDRINERIAEEVVEGALGAEIDSEDGSVTVKNDDGEVTFGDQKLPEEFPSSLPLPSKHAVTSSMKFSQGEELSITASLSTELAFDDAVNEITEGFGSEWTAENEPFEMTADGLESWQNVVQHSDGTKATVMVQSVEGETTVTYIIERKPSE